MTTEKVKRYDMRFLDCAVRPYEDGAFVKYEDYVRITDAHQREMAQRITPRGNDMIVPSALLDEINATGAAWKARAETAETELARLRVDGEPMFGGMIEADFEANTITFEMRGDYVCAAGLYEIRRHRAAIDTLATQEEKV